MSTSEQAVEAENLLSRREVAHLARVHPNTVKNVWERNGWLTRVEIKVGRQMEVRYRRDEVEALIAERRSQHEPAYDPEFGNATRLAALEAENTLLREELDRLRKQHEDLLQEILRRTRD